MKPLYILFSLLLVTSLIGCKDKKSKETKLFVKPFEVGNVSLDDSWIKERETLNTEYIRNFDADRLLHNFRINVGLSSSAKPLDGWESPGCGLRGHFTGHYLSALSSLVEKTNDEVLIEKLNYLVEGLKKCQEASSDGYLSAFPKTEFDNIEGGRGAWAPYYTYHKIMQGLLDAYSKGSNPQALEMVKKMADYAYTRISKLDNEAKKLLVKTIGSNPLNETGGMNEALYNLYTLVPDDRYLEMAKLFDGEWLLKPLANNQDILSGLHANTHLAIVNGFLKGYSVLHDEEHYQAAKNFWDILIKSHVFVNGSSSGPRPNPTTPTAKTSEHWCTPNVLSMSLTGHEAESCVSHNTMRLTGALFQLSPDPKYADTYMNMYYNTLLALQNNHSGEVVYHLPLGSQRQKNWLNNESDFRCCNGTSIEAFTHLTDNIYFHDANDENIWINLYIPSTLKWPSCGVVIRQLNDIAHDDNQVIEIVNGSGEFVMNLFVPSWSRNTEVIVNGESQGKPVAGTYHSIRRDWKEGDKIELKTTKDLYCRSMSDDSTLVALSYGAVLLAIESEEEITFDSTVDDIIKKIKPSEDNSLNFTFEHRNKIYKLKPLFDITNEKYTVYFRSNPNFGTYN